MRSQEAEDAGDGCFDSVKGFDFTSQIYEKDVKAVFAQQFAGVEAEGLADAAFQQVAPDGALEVALGHRYHHPGKGAFAREIIGLNRVLEEHRAALQQGVDLRLAAEDMAFGQ